jgi:hypothetical protein
MRISNQKKLEIVGAFQRSFKIDNKEEIESIKLEDLKQANEMLGERDINAPFRLAMQSRIKEVEDLTSKKEQRLYESKIRAWNLITGIIIGLIIAGIAKFLFG